MIWKRPPISDMPRYHKLQMCPTRDPGAERQETGPDATGPSGRHKLTVAEDMRRKPWGKSIAGAKLHSRGWGGVGETPTRLRNRHTCAPSSKALPP